LANEVRKAGQGKWRRAEVLVRLSVSWDRSVRGAGEIQYIGTSDDIVDTSLSLNFDFRPDRLLRHL
jgi:hypothetical protein